MTPADVTLQALSWCGVPFRWQGRSRAGLDCGGLAAVVGEALGALLEPLQAPRYRPPVPNGYLLKELRRHFIERQHEAKAAGCGNRSPECCDDCRKSLAGCIVVFGKASQHCGIVTDDGRLVSVSDAAGCHAVDYDAGLIRLTRQVFEFPGVEYA